MHQILLQVPFASTKKEIAEALSKVTADAFKERLGKPPTKAELPRFTSSPNPLNSSITDLYFDGIIYGSLSTTYILDSPRGIVFQFTPNKVGV